MKTARRFLSGVVAVLATVVAAQAAAPTGTWSANNNGYTGYLAFSVDGQGDRERHCVRRRDSGTLE